MKRISKVREYRTQENLNLSGKNGGAILSLECLLSANVD